MIARYGCFLEKETFEGRTADFVWMIMLGMVTMLPLPLVAPSLELPFFAASLVYMLLYLWWGAVAQARPRLESTTPGFSNPF